MTTGGVTLIFTPTNPSKRSPHVRVTVRGVTMRFWMNPHTTHGDVEALELALAALPLDFAWRANAVYTSQHNQDEPGPDMGYDVAGYSFALEISSKCTQHEFDGAFATFCRDVRQAALD